MQIALSERDVSVLGEAAHKLSRMLSAFSTAAKVASGVEDHAAAGRLDEARPLVRRLETMTLELLCQAGDLSLEALRREAATAGP